MVQPSFVTPQSRPTSTPECWQLLTSTPFESTTKIPGPQVFSPAIQSCGGEQTFYWIIMVALDLFDTRYTRKSLDPRPSGFHSKVCAHLHPGVLTASDFNPIWIYNQDLSTSLTHPVQNRPLCLWCEKYVWFLILHHHRHHHHLGRKRGHNMLD